MIKVTLTNEILKRITAINENRFSLSKTCMPAVTRNRLRKLSLIHIFNVHIFDKEGNDKGISQLPI